MAYDIVFKRRFIDVEDGRYIPIVLIGSNNLRDAYTNKIVREWWVYQFQPWHVAAYTEKQMMDCIDKKIAEYEDLEGYTPEFFRWNGKMLDCKAYKSFFKNGIKDAVTIGQLAEHQIYLRADVSAYKYTDMNDKRLLNTKYVELDNRSIMSKGELLLFLDDAEVLISRLSKDEYYSARSLFTYPNEDCIDVFSKRRKNNNERPAGKYYALKDKAYISKLTKNRLQCTYIIDSAKLFKSEKEAYAWLDKYRINERFGSDFELAEVEIEEWRAKNYS